MVTRELRNKILLNKYFNMTCIIIIGQPAPASKLEQAQNYEGN